MNEILFMISNDLTHYEIIFKDVRFGVVLHSPDGKIIFHNPMANVILGLSHEEIIDAKSTDPRWKTYKEDGSFFKGEDHPSMQVIKKKTKCENTLMKLYNPNINDFKWIQIDAYPIFEEDNSQELKYVFVTFFDITEKINNICNAKKSEIRFNSLFQSMKEGVALHRIIYDIEGNAYDYEILEVNPSYLNLLGLSADQVINKTSREAYQTTFAPYLDIYNEAVKNKAFANFEVYFQPLNKFFDINVVCYEEDHFATIFADISHRKSDEEMIKNQLEELSRKNNEMEEFNYTVSHDLKSPLLTILGFTEHINADLMRKQYDKIPNSLDKISMAASRMQLLIDDLLRLSRAGRISTQAVLIDTESLLKELVEIIQVRYPRHKYSIQHYLPCIYGDRVRIREVFQNIIENAFKFSNQATHPEINIKYKDGFFFIEDNGEGVHCDFHQKAFLPFNKYNSKSEGSEIGLSIVKKIIQHYNGYIEINSEGEGKGTQVKFSLPVFQSREDFLSHNSINPSFISWDRKDFI